MFTATTTVKRNRVAAKIRRVKALSDISIDRACEAILAEALRRVKVGATGALRDGLRIRNISDDERVHRKAVGVWGVREAGFVENGTVRQHAQPYLRPSANLARRMLRTDYQAAIAAAARVDE